MSYESGLCSSSIHPLDMTPEHRQAYFNNNNPFTKEKSCEMCLKNDVCPLQNELHKAIEDILDIEKRTNVFIKTVVTCEKYAAKHVSNGIR
jgi:hypothetical protein